MCLFFYDPGSITVEDLMALCKGIYKMGVKVEHEWTVIDTFSFRLSMQMKCDFLSGPVHLRLKPRVKGKLSGP